MFDALTDNMFRYHATFGVQKKIVTADDKLSLHDVIRQEFGIDSSPLLLQSWDTEFEDWVNVADIMQLPDKCKLQVVVKGVHRQFSCSIF